MSSNIVANVTITGNLLVQGLYSNVASLNTGALSGPFLVQGSTTAASTFKISSGYKQTAVILADGTVRMFGDSGQGQLGIGVAGETRETPVQVFGISSSAVAVSCKWFHSLFLLADGTVQSCGGNFNGQLGDNSTNNKSTPVRVWGISSSAVAIANGYYFSLVLLGNGTVLGFGAYNNGKIAINVSGDGSRLTPVQIFGISSSATAVACGSQHAAVLLADGTVRTFGDNGYGQLGINAFGGSRQTPVMVSGITTATAIECGSNQTAILLADGTVRTFGDNTAGQLGIDVNGGTRQTPVQVFGISSSATAISCGQYHTVVLLRDGTIRGVGANSDGRLGLNDNTQRNTPVQVFGISSSAVAIAGGGYQTAVLLADGTVRTFGRNDKGQLGINVTSGTRSTPVQVITALSYGGSFKIGGGSLNTAVILADGTVRTFGYNQEGELGLNNRIDQSSPVQVFGISSSATAIACGWFHMAVLLADGTVRTFGFNYLGELGINVAGAGSSSRQTPVQVFGISSSATAVAGGRYYTAVLLADGTVRTFGGNSNGQLGINVNGGTRQTPVQVFGISSSATAVACGSYHAAVLLADGTVRTFGFNNNGQLGVGDATTRQTPVQVLNITSAVAVAGGQTHTAVLLADGTVRTFGYNGTGQLGVGGGAQSRETPVQVFGISSSAVAVACGDSHTAVLLADGTVRTFGLGNFGQLGINADSNRLTPVQVFEISSSATAVACGGTHTVVLLADGTVRTFGYNNRGQLGINVSGGSRLTPVTVLNITNAGSLVSTTFLLSTAAIITYPFIQFPALNLGPVTYPQYQLELTTDYARKLTTSTWTIGSDERLKTDIETANVDRCVEIVQNLDLKRFAWNFPDGSQPPDSHSLGWIAQEFAQFFPNSVNEAPAHGIMDFKNLNSDQIIKVMWGALKKLRADLKSRKSSDSELSTAGDNASPTPE